MGKLFTILNSKHFHRLDAEKKMLELACFYSEDISKPGEVVDEFHSFRTLYSELAMDLNTDAVLPFLIATDMDRAYPHLTIVHRIYKIIPMSSASAEQSFSRLRLIKSYLRSRMDAVRLSSLTLMCVEKDINTDKDKVVGRFATMKEWRRKF